MPSPSSLLTRASLLFRLRDWQDAASWEEFFRLYRDLVYGLARRSGLNHDDAEEVTQDVFKRVAETIQSFEGSRDRGSFRCWLRNLTRWRVADKFRERAPYARLAAISGPREDDRGTGTIDRIPDPGLSNPRDAYDAAWETEWRANLLAAALARVARQCPAKHFQIFDLYTRQQWPALRIARELGVNAASVYLINHRLTKRLRAEIARVESQLG
jgi:RNA polymerase sigma factor (sigma-70 family)